MWHFRNENVLLIQLPSANKWNIDFLYHAGFSNWIYVVFKTSSFSKKGKIKQPKEIVNFHSRNDLKVSFHSQKLLKITIEIFIVNALIKFDLLACINIIRQFIILNSLCVFAILNNWYINILQMRESFCLCGSNEICDFESIVWMESP